MTKKKKRIVLPVNEWLKTLPAKRVATQVIYTNIQDDVMLVKPNYRDDWLLPGGIVEKGESLIDGVVREIHEELSAAPKYLVFAGVDYYPEVEYERHDFVHLFFDGGYLSDDEIAALKREEDEIDEIKFIPIEQIDQYATPQQAKRIRAFRASYPTPLFLNEGKRIDTAPGGQSFQFVNIVAQVVVEKDGKYLMVQEEQAIAHGKWAFPGGKVDAGESIKDCAVREAKEEANIDVKLERLLSVDHKSIHAPVAHTFLVTTFTGKPRPQPGEILQVDWFTLQEMREMRDELRGVEYTLEIIEQYEASKS